MIKFISILFFALLLCTDSATASDNMTYVSDGQFKFSLLVRHSGSYVNYSKLDLFFQDFARLKKAMVFDDITITSTGQTFILTKSDNGFSEAGAFLTNSLPDWINVSLITPTRTSSVEATEPAAFFGDASGSSGIDFASWSIESITLRITGVFLKYGYDFESQGAYTDIIIQGVVTVGYGGSPLLDADFLAAPTRGMAPLTVQFTDESMGAVDSWNWTFGDGSSSSLRNPSHLYNNPGRYTVTLTVTGSNSTDTITKTDYIKVNPAVKNLPWLLLLLGN
jgi:PKD repeat protein